MSVVPAPGGLSTASRPPSDSTRAARPCSPVPRVLHAPPAPLSETSATSVRPCWVAETRSSVAAACLSALESASETRNHTVASTTEVADGPARVDPERERRLCSQRGERASQAALEPDGMQAAREFAQLTAGDGGLFASGGQAVLGLQRVSFEIP